MTEPGDAPRKIKVVDRRRFDESGDLRPDRPEPAPKAAPADPPAETPPVDPQPQTPETAPPPEPTPEPPPPGAGPGPSPLFLDLVAGLAQQAEILLTGGQGLPAQPAEAQRVIDYLTMLESKTEGNLTPEEKQILSNVIFQLRTLYVQHNA